MDQHALTALGRHINEVKYLIGHLVIRIEKYLVLLVYPIEGQIGNADIFPHVSHCIPCTIDYVRHFVSSYKFEVLTTKTTRQTVNKRMPKEDRL